MASNVRIIVAAITLILLLGYFGFRILQRWDNEYDERHEKRKELIQVCTEQGGTPVITFSRTGKLTGYYGCTLPQGTK